MQKHALISENNFSIDTKKYITKIWVLSKDYKEKNTIAKWLVYAPWMKDEFDYHIIILKAIGKGFKQFSTATNSFNSYGVDLNSNLSNKNQIIIKNNELKLEIIQHFYASSGAQAYEKIERHIKKIPDGLSIASENSPTWKSLLLSKNL